MKDQSDDRSGGGYSMGQWIGLGLSFSITMLANIAIAMFVGRWLDRMLGTEHIFWLLGLLCGIFAGFHLFIEQIEQLEHPTHPSDRE